VIAIDTSGSITRSMIEQFLSETMKITDVYNPQKTVILYCDTQVYEPDILEPGDSPNFDKIAGGGGTNFWPPFKWVQKNMIENGEVPTVFIYFTDGFATFPSNLDYDIDTYEDRCIWVFLSFDGKPFEDDQPFGERIDITLANKNIKTI
jgi:predicted metal-dependent peptidase